MHAAQPICILWDSSHIWGLMAWRAVRAMGLPCRLVKGKEIAQGALLGKPHGGNAPDTTQPPAHTEKQPSGRASLLLVPGGNARLKAAGLGDDGIRAVRRWMEEGGNYLGFCGGAGLALSHAAPQQGLGICPWGRAAYPERLHHLISGHARVRVCDNGEFSFRPPPRPNSVSPKKQQAAAAPAARTCPGAGKAAGRVSARCLPLSAGTERPPSLPVWWPGRFAAEDNSGVHVLASYDAPDADFWLADLPLQSIPPHIFGQWQELYGVNLLPDFLKGQPLVVSGRHGRGNYVLSYSHLETPHSPDANAWLAQLLHQLTGLEPDRADVPLWQLRHPCHAWPEDSAPLLNALRHMRDLLDLAVEHHLFFARTHWLWGWRTGLPGAACNNLHAALCTAASLEPSATALAYWRVVRPRFSDLADRFAAGAEGYFLACRLAETLSPSLPDAVNRRGLDCQRHALFGHPMSGGGLMEELLDITEELVFLSQDSTPCDLR
ncbi:Biotin-protein ligase, N terminal [Desulfovibrio desulfuricans]|uniref:Biotin-protein ligase, N terminal n=2 Tax=Desulfovibrionaceae TaxID=194924 RepID=A0AA94HR42_DESDE|nr:MULTISPECIES: BPL-N domain-containing protein [Desulfovibrio]ATD80283.1 hypothetical protein CNY67_01725 [Desulfovibrio sp. G11]SFW13164.1 Biotin-protein ligase, N terminal [Desulfovibrio desulfuricans]SPD35758.1 Biotin-protein ligase, N-terminal [Desulfovibrio sp. G11]